MRQVIHGVNVTRNVFYKFFQALLLIELAYNFQ